MAHGAHEVESIPLGTEVKLKKKPLSIRVGHAKYLYLLILPGLIWMIIFKYGPMYGAQIAFRDYMFNLGFWHSPWVGLENFERMFIDPAFFRALRNTLIISFGKIIWTFPVPILLALFFNELRTGLFKKGLQTIYTFPNFLSWVTVAGIVLNVFGSRGAINAVIQELGFERVRFLVSTDFFRPLIYISDNWKTAGWGSIIYLAAISGIDPALYEAATIDGAGRWQKMFRITLPSIRATIMILLILNIGGLMNAGFDQVFNLYNPAVYETGDIIDTFIYRVTFQQGFTDYSFTTAVGLFKSVVNFLLIISANRLGHALGQPTLTREAD